MGKKSMRLTPHLDLYMSLTPLPTWKPPGNQDLL